MMVFLLFKPLVATGMISQICLCTQKRKIMLQMHILSVRDDLCNSKWDNFMLFEVEGRKPVLCIRKIRTIVSSNMN